MIDVTVLVASEIVSAGLAFALVYFFFKAYRLTRFVHLLGLPVGFSFLAFSYIFFGTSILYVSSSGFSEVFLWLRSVTQSYGFAFIAFSYYFPRRTQEKRARRILGFVSLASAVSVFVVFVGMFILPPSLELPANDVVEEWFRIANLVFLAYIVYTLVRYLGSSKGTVSGLMWAPSAFSLFAIGQYSQLIDELDGSQTAFILAHIFRLSALLLLIGIYCASGRERNETGET